MTEKTKISWCDVIFNPWRCGPNGTRKKTSARYWKQLFRWDREAAMTGERRRVFCASLADVFEDWQGPILNAKGEIFWNDGRTVVECPPTSQLPDVRLLTMTDLRRDLFVYIDQTPNLDWLLLTKRPENIRRMWRESFAPGLLDGDGKAPYRKNVWLLTSVSDQATADRIIPELLKCRDLCPVLGISAEPLLGEICLHDLAFPEEKNRGIAGLDWVIAGGESGPHAWSCDVRWLQSLRDQCGEVSVPFFLKQMGSKAYRETEFGRAYFGFNDPKGGDTSEWPGDLRVREFPANNPLHGFSAPRP